MLEKIDQEKGTRGNRLFYLATAPEYFAAITERLGAQGMAKPQKGSVRIIIEKPFGHDLESARKLNDDVNAIFDENQVFRIDHYLGKETVQNILVFRFANGIFEPIWNRNFVDPCRLLSRKVSVSRAADLSTKRLGRSETWFRITSWNFCLFIAMEPPISFEADAVRIEKLKVWKAISEIPIGNTARGQ